MADHRTRGPIRTRQIKKLPDGKVVIINKVVKTGNESK